MNTCFATSVLKLKRLFCILLFQLNPCSLGVSVKKKKHWRLLGDEARHTQMKKTDPVYADHSTHLIFSFASWVCSGWQQPGRIHQVPRNRRWRTVSHHRRLWHPGDYSRGKGAKSKEYFRKISAWPLWMAWLWGRRSGKIQSFSFSNALLSSWKLFMCREEVPSLFSHFFSSLLILAS